MTLIESTLARIRYVGVAAVLIVVLVMTASPAAAHHPPDPPSGSDAAGQTPVHAGGADSIPFRIVIASSTAVLALLAWRSRRRHRPDTGPHRPPRITRRAVAIAAVTAVAAVPLTTVRTASAATVLLPDLVSDDPDPVGGVEVNSFTGEDRLVLRFEGYVANVGAGALEVSGNPQLTDPIDADAVHQRAVDTEGIRHVVGTPTVQFETADGHNHFHLMEIGRYSLWNFDRSAEAAPGQKVGFCLYDIEPAEPEDYSGSRDPLTYTGAVTRFCEANNPTSTELIMGTGAGWRDVYGSHLTFQWVDVSNTAPGVYWLANEADPHDRVLESDEDNNDVAFANTPSTVPGHNAVAVGPIEIAGVDEQITLDVETFGSPGPVEFVIVDGPEHGTVDVPIGAPRSSAEITYTPDAGYSGCDSIRYVARDSTSDFPLNPIQASVALVVGAAGCPGVAISGAPAAVVVGTSAALAVAVSGADPGVVWSVDGVVGGDATLGSISEAGLYVAPGRVPAAGSVTIRAVLASDPSVFDEVSIDIEPTPNDAPLMSDPGDQLSMAGDDVTLVIETSDPDGDPFGFTATGLPVGLAIHASTGVVTGTATSAGVHEVTITADDGREVSTVEFDWVVAPPFVDVDRSAWYGPSVTWLAGYELTTGTSPGSFSPDRAVTRAEAVTLLWRWVGRPGAPASRFDDLRAGSYYEVAVAWAAAVGVVIGTSAATFEPDATMTRAQLAAVFHRLAGAPAASGSAPFADVPAGRYFTAAVAWLAEEGLTTGVAPSIYDPDGVVTRAQFATVLCRYTSSRAATAVGAINGSARCNPI